jgi:phage baseplate assembly protein W
VDRIKERHEENFLGTGWAFPVSFSDGNYQLQTSAYEKNVNENIHAILLTQKGERPMEPGFGSGLEEFYFGKMDETLRGRIADTVRTTLRTNEPRITVTDVIVEFPDMLTGLVDIQIRYVYNQTNTRHNYVFPFSIKEGTSLPG